MFTQMPQARRVLLVFQKLHSTSIRYRCQYLSKSLNVSLLKCRNVHSTGLKNSIFRQNEAQSLEQESDVPDIGQAMESWHYSVLKDGRITVRSLLDVHVQPIDPQKYPEMNKLFINILYMGKDKLSPMELSDLTKEYIVNVDLDDNNEGAELTIKQKTSKELATLCHIQVPIKYDVEVFCFKTADASVSKLEGEKITVRTQKGDCVFNNVKGIDVEARTKEGNIHCEKLLQGNLKLVADGHGEISAGRLQGHTIDCQSNHGDVKVKAIYADRTWLNSSNGNISLGSCHGKTQLSIDNGNLTIDTLDGDLTGKVSQGDANISMSREGNLHLETDQGDISLSVPESVDCRLSLEASEVNPGDVVIHNKLLDNDSDHTSLTGDLQPKTSQENLIMAKTRSGVIKLSYYDWFASLNLNK